MIHHNNCMVLKMLSYFCFLAVILGVRSASAPFIKPCKVDDNACIVASAQASVPSIAAGVPELGIKPLDPLKLDIINGDNGGLQLTFKDTTVTGMKSCSIDGVKLDMKKQKQTVTLSCPNVELTGYYKLGGHLLILPIQGEGKYDINIRDIIIKTYNDVEMVTGDDGKKHLHIVKWRQNYQVKTNTHFHFDNLFNGNKVLGDPVEEFANSNWREVMKEIASPVVESVVKNVVEAVEALYKAVPADELYLDYN